ncbi:MAG TPA: HAMP domain-containing sensor histidine kinase [Erysipelothrix sp.]|nr:HAMP domain-containing sensor histidine kinase [Erysipelothrix sp.]
MLQISFLEPYYKASRSKNMIHNISEVEKVMRGTVEAEQRNNLRLLFARENMCAIVYNDKGINVMDIAVDALGQSCYLNQISDLTKNDYIELINNSNTSHIDIPFRDEQFEQAMTFYAKSFTVEDESFYIFVNAPMELLDSTVDILKNQFIMVSVMVFTVGTTIALLLSRKLAYPIHHMNESAKRLAKGDFSVKFEAIGYQEAIELSETLNFATEEFSKTDELRKDLVANVSHDIKTPLTMIKAYAEMISDISGDNKDLRNQHLQVIIDESKHLEKLVNDMLSLSQYESNVLEINEIEFNLKDHITSTLNLFQTSYDRFEVICSPDITVLADEVKMGQVLFNFVNNAIKHNDNDENIVIKVKKTMDEKVEISVIDKGKGIPKESQKEIWDRYTKINKHHQRNIDSTGLGLSIVAAICEATGSEYGVESDIDKGARFYYTLKLAKKSRKHR